MSTRVADRPSAARIWLMAARPRTLPAAVAPVLVGTALAATEGTFHALVFVAAMIGALFIQVGTNLSNDYSDARRGADTEDRLGPVRVTAGGLVPPRQVLVATYVAFGVAVLAGVYLIAVAGWELLLIGVASILAGVLYTGGPRPYGYEGLGEVFVFLFFGVVAVAGSYFAQVRAARRGRRSCSPCRSACSRPRSWSSTTCATSRPTGAPASARWRCGSGARGRAGCTLRWSTSRFSCAPLPWLPAPTLSAVAAAVVAGAAAGGAGRADRAQAHRRPVAERRARAHRAAAARVLRAAVRGHPGELMAELAVEPGRSRLRAPLRAAWGELPSARC